MIIVAGKNNIAVHALHELVNKFGRHSVGVVPTENDVGDDSWQRSLIKAASILDVKVFDLAQVEDNSTISCFLSLEFDKIVRVEKFPAGRIFNIHFSNLPDYKGMYTSLWPILNGDMTAGVTLHQIERGIDTGDVIATKIFEIDESMRSYDLYKKYIEYAIDLFDENIDLLLSGDFDARPQSHQGARYFSKASFDFSSIKLDLNVTAWQLQRQIYAYSFRPYQLVQWQSKKIVEINISTCKSSLRPGTIIEESSHFVKLSTIDFDVTLFFDKFEQLIHGIPDFTVAELEKALENTCGVNDQNDRGWSAIIVAAYHGRQDLIEVLLENGANINDKNFKGTTVLMYAKDFCLKNKDLSLFNYLLSQGADVGLKDHKGKTVLDYLSPSQADVLGLKI